MGNNRKNIRHAVKALLENATSAGPNVFTNRDLELHKNELPAINILNGDESGTPRGTDGRLSIRSFTMNIELKIEMNDTADDELDDLASEIEAILTANPDLSATAIKCVYQSTSSPTINSESEKDIGTATLIYEIQYIG